VRSFAVRALGDATVVLAHKVAPHIKRGASRILPNSVQTKGADGRSKMDDVGEVAIAGIKGMTSR